MRRALLAAVAVVPLATAVSATLLLVGASQPAFADGGAGAGHTEGAGGTDSATGSGGAGGRGLHLGGGGGGAGALGGKGGDGDEAEGGAGGSSPGTDGADGSNSSNGGASGGGGGAHGFVGVGLPTGVSAGGDGGNGGNGGVIGSFGGGGGGGGAGGSGAVVVGSNLDGSLGSALIGGEGGFGGSGSSSGGRGGNGGSGGSGGSGLRFIGTNGTVTIGGSVSGGYGGDGGGGALARGGNGGNGGDGIVGDGLNLIVNVDVSGGWGGFGGVGGESGNGGSGGNGIAGNGLRLVVNGSVSGGDGGVGGGGGNGGNAGAGIAGNGLRLVVNGSVSGGDGGNGDGGGGKVGNAGAGIAGNGLSLVINGSVRGGDGGRDGGGGGAGGGAGVIGQNLNVIVSGVVAGGLGGDGTTRADAITFTGGTNMLELRSGFGFSGNVVASGTSTLRFGGGTDAVFDLGTLGTSFSGFNTLEKSGAATWTLTGRSTFAGPTTVNAGTLLVDGALARSAFTVRAGGILGGTGNVADLTVSGGLFAPGAPGTPGSRMTVQGSLILDAASTYRVFVDPAVVSSALVTGTATLSGATVDAHFAPGAYVARQYTILQTGGLVGTFGSVTVSGLPNFTARTFNQGKDVILELSAKLGVGVPGDPVVNPEKVAGALNDFFNDGATLPQPFLNLFGLSGDAMRNALGQASGELGASASSSTFFAWQQFFNLIFDQFAENPGFGGALPYAAERSAAVRQAYAAVTPEGLEDKVAPIGPLAARWSMWGGSYGGSERISGNAASGSHDTTSRAYGLVGGANYQLTSGTLIGFALAGGSTSSGLAQGLGGGTSELFQASVYARQHWGAAYLMGAFGYGLQDFTLKRTVTISGIESLQADFKAHTLAGRVETGFRFGSSFAGMTPYGAVQVVSLDLPGYAELSTVWSTSFALSHAGRTDTWTRSELGARFDYAIPLRDALLTLRGRAAWAHDYGEGRIASAEFLALPGSVFTVNGATPDRNAVLVSAGTELALRSGFSLAGSFEGEFSRNTDSYAGKGALRYRW